MSSRRVSGVELALAPREQLGTAVDRGDGCAQLVRDDAVERVTELARAALGVDQASELLARGGDLFERLAARRGLLSRAITFVAQPVRQVRHGTAAEQEGQ